MDGQMDVVEASFQEAIARAVARGDNDAAQEHTVHLQEYRDHYKIAKANA